MEDQVPGSTDKGKNANSVLIGTESQGIGQVDYCGEQQGRTGLIGMGRGATSMDTNYYH